MLRASAVVCLAVVSAAAFTQNRSSAGASAPAASAPATPQKDLPVRKIVLYKNGVGYFEHVGTVTGNQTVSVDFTSAQLNDVLQSLTVLDEGGGRVGGVTYNSTTPLAEQLKALALGMSDDPSSTELFQALRGQRVEVSGGPGGVFAGRLMSIESRTEKAGAGDATVDRFYLTVVGMSGGVRVMELTPSLTVRPLDPALEGDLNRYLELLSTARSNGLRHLRLSANGQGQRQLRVSYISEVPVWKSTYRIVFARGGGEKADATVQGWAVVDNTVGVDWDNVQLSLVAGAPQSFIQPLSQPLYTRRPEIPIATTEQTTPQTHEAAEMKVTGRNAAELIKMMPGAGAVSGSDAGAPVDTAEVSATLNNELVGKADRFRGGVGAGLRNRYRAPNGGPVSGSAMAALGSSSGGVMRASDAFAQGDVATTAFDDFFEYAIAQPVTIHKNESAMVPILQQDLPAEHVTLWSDGDRNALRAVWLENTSKLTLDSGSFSIFENGEFAGEGLLDPIHPGEKRLLSYAVDEAVKVRRTDTKSKRTLHHVAMHDGILVETDSDINDGSYVVSNGAAESRTIVIEHSRMPGGELASDTKPAESTPTAYRFRVLVEAHGTSKLQVTERANTAERIRIDPNDDRTAFLLNLSHFSPELETRLKPLIDAERALYDLNAQMVTLEEKEKSLAADEERDRNNVTALKGNEAAKRFVDELNRTEDDLQATRKERAGLELQRDVARIRLSALIANFSFDRDIGVAAPANTGASNQP